MDQADLVVIGSGGAAMAAVFEAQANALGEPMTVDSAAGLFRSDRPAAAHRPRRGSREGHAGCRALPFFRLFGYTAQRCPALTSAAAAAALEETSWPTACSPLTR